MTSVFREILYHSLNADRIYGGELLIDRLVVPTPGSGYLGTGSIDGPEYTIGYNKIIAYAGAESIVAKPSSPGGLSSIILVQNASGTPLLRLGQISSASYIELLDYNVETRLTPTLSYFKQKVLIGSDSATVSGKLRVIGGSEFDSITVTSSANFPLITPTAYDFQTASGTLNTAIENIQDLKGIADPLEPLVLAGSGRLTYDIVTQLGKMPGGSIDISSSEWTYLSTMQNVSTTATVQFSECVCSHYSEVQHSDLDGYGFWGAIDPNIDVILPDGHLTTHYKIQSYEERSDYTARLCLDVNDWADVHIKFVVVGKMCTFYLMPTEVGGVIKVTNTTGTPQVTYLVLDLRDTAYSKIWQSFENGTSVRYPLTVYGTGLVIYPSEAIMPVEFDQPGWLPGGVALAKGISIGQVGTVVNISTRPTTLQYTVAVGNSLTLNPQVFNWITK